MVQFQNTSRDCIFSRSNTMSKCLRPHDSVHVCRVALLRTTNNGRGSSQTFGNGYTLDIWSVQLFEEFGKGLECFSVDLCSALGHVLIFIAELDTLLGNI